MKKPLLKINVFAKKQEVTVLSDYAKKYVVGGDSLPPLGGAWEEEDKIIPNDHSHPTDNLDDYYK